MEFVLFMFLIFAFSISFRIYKNNKREKELLESGIFQVDQMPGRVFEEYLKILLTSKGYKVRMTPASGDYGADLVLSANGRTIVVQVKRYKKKVGLKAVQEIASAKSYYKADECWVITNNYFTTPAINLAKSNSVELFDRDVLIKLMLEEKRNKVS